LRARHLFIVFYLMVKGLVVFTLNQGTKVMKTEAMNIEEQRKIKKEKAERKARWVETRARKLLKKAQEIEDSWPKDIIHDIAFLTQPGHIPMRARIIRQHDKVLRLREEAKRLLEKAENIRIYGSRIKGDAERAREEKREKLDREVQIGSRVFCSLYGWGEILKVFKKSYRVKFDRGFVLTVDKVLFELRKEE